MGETILGAPEEAKPRTYVRDLRARAGTVARRALLAKETFRAIKTVAAPRAMYSTMEFSVSKIRPIQATPCASNTRASISASFARLFALASQAVILLGSCYDLFVKILRIGLSKDNVQQKKE